MSRHPVLSIRCSTDALLHHVAPIGLAAARDTALLVDLDPSAPAYPGALTVAGLAADGIHRDQLRPSAAGVAVLANGGAGVAESLELVEALSLGWPAVVVRIGPSDVAPFPLVPVSTVLPLGEGIDPTAPGVRQRLRGRARSGVDGVELPALRRGQVWAMVEGRVSPRWAWVRAWRPVWEMPWE